MWRVWHLLLLLGAIHEVSATAISWISPVSTTYYAAVTVTFTCPSLPTAVLTTWTYTSGWFLSSITNTTYNVLIPFQNTTAQQSYTFYPATGVGSPGGNLSIASITSGTPISPYAVLPDGAYTFTMAYTTSATGDTWLTADAQTTGVTFSTRIIPPIIYSPKPNTYWSSWINFTYVLPSQPTGTANLCNLTITPAGSGTATVLEINPALYYSAATPWVFDAINTSGIALASLGAFQVQISGPSVLPGGNYTFLLQYQDYGLHGIASATSTSVIVQTVTPLPTLYVTGAPFTFSNPVTITYFLPLAGSNTVQLTLNGTQTGNQYVLTGLPYAEGNNTYMISLTNPTIAFDTYNFTLSYQDFLNNPPASATVANIIVATSTLPPIVTWPISTVRNPLQVPNNGSFTLNFTLPEAATPGTVQAIFSNVSSVTMVSGHAFTLSLPSTKATQSYQIDVTNVSAFGVNGPIPSGTYVVQIAYMDTYANPVATSIPFWIYVLYPAPVSWYLSSPAASSVQSTAFTVACTTACFDAPAVSTAFVSVVLNPIGSNNDVSIALTYYPIVTNPSSLQFTLDPLDLSVTNLVVSNAFPQLAAISPPGLTSIPDGAWSLSVAVSTVRGLQVSVPVSFFIQTGALPLTILQPAPNAEIGGGMIRMMWTVPYSLNGSSNPYVSISNASGELAVLSFANDLNGTLEIDLDMLSIANSTCPSECMSNLTINELAPGAYNLSLTYFSPSSWATTTTWTTTVQNVNWYLYPLNCPGGLCASAPIPLPDAPLEPSTSAQTNGPAAWNALPYWAWIVILVGGTLILTLTLTLVILICVSKGRSYSIVGGEV